MPYVVVCSSGSAALYMSLIALGIGKDDEVIIPDRTYVATANAALLAGAKFHWLMLVIMTQVLILHK